MDGVVIDSGLKWQLERIVRNGWKDLARCDASEADEVKDVLTGVLNTLENLVEAE